MNKIILLALLTAILLFSSSQAKSGNYDSLITAGIKQIYNIEFTKAENTFALVKKNYPSDASGYFFDAMIVWWKIMLDQENTEYDDLFVKKLNLTIDKCDELIENNPDNADHYFFKGGALGFRGRLYSVREKWFQAASDGKDALPLVEKVAQLDSANKDIKLGFGIYNYYAATIPDKFPVVKPFMIFFPKGNRAKGLEQLHQVAMTGKFAKYETRFFLLTIFFNFEENNEKALEYAEMLYKQFPANPVFHRYIGRLAIKMRRNDEAFEIFRDIYKKCKTGKSGYNANTLREASYYIAAEYERRNKLDSALTLMGESRGISLKIDKDGQSGFLVNSTLYIAKMYEKSAEFEKSLRFFKIALGYNEYKNSHTEAKNGIKRVEKFVEK